MWRGHWTLLLWKGWMVRKGHEWDASISSRPHVRRAGMGNSRAGLFSFYCSHLSTQRCVNHPLQPAAVADIGETLKPTTRSSPLSTPKTLNAYELVHIPGCPPDTVAALASFFATLAPPPLLHCVWCHAEYTEVENRNRSCRVPCEDESADVEWVGRGRGHCVYKKDVLGLLWQDG
jgi:hypothetical protein